MNNKSSEKYYLYLLIFIFLFGFCLFGFYKLKGKDPGRKPILDLSAYTFEEEMIEVDELNNIEESKIEENKRIYFSNYFSGKDKEETKLRVKSFLENFPEIKKLLDSNLVFEKKDKFVIFLEVKELNEVLEKEIKELIEDYKDLVMYGRD